MFWVLKIWFDFHSSLLMPVESAFILPGPVNLSLPGPVSGSVSLSQEGDEEVASNCQEEKKNQDGHTGWSCNSGIFVPRLINQIWQGIEVDMGPFRHFRKDFLVFSHDGNLFSGQKFACAQPREGFLNSAVCQI